MKSQRLLKRMLGVAGRILGIAGENRPAGFINENPRLKAWAVVFRLLFPHS